MGGINHQPCGSYLKLSTRVSTKLSLLQVVFWQSNVEFEKSILESLENQKTSLQPAILQINKAINIAEKTKETLKQLIQKMQFSNFQELPETLRVLDTINNALKKEAEIIFPENSVQNVTSILDKHGFNGLFTRYQKEIELIQNNLKLVQKDFLNLSNSKNLIIDCEENNIDIRINFTRTLLLINKLISEWAYSSLTSATMWNLNQGHKTLVHLDQTFYKKIQYAV